VPHGLLLAVVMAAPLFLGDGGEALTEAVAELPLLALPTSSGGADGARRHGDAYGARIHGGEGTKTWIPLCVDMRYAAAPPLPLFSLSFFTHLTILPSLFSDPVKEPPRARFEKVD